MGMEAIPRRESGEEETKRGKGTELEDMVSTGAHTRATPPGLACSLLYYSEQSVFYATDGK